MLEFPTYSLPIPHFHYKGVWFELKYSSYEEILAFNENCVDTDQTPRSVPSNLCLQCLFQYPSIPAARFAFRLCFIRFVLLFGVVLSGEPKTNQGRGLVDFRLVQAPPAPPPPPPPVSSLLAVSRRLFYFGSLVI